MRGNTRSSRALLLVRLLAVVSTAVVAAAFVTPQARAAVPAFPDNCGGVNNFDYAVCERLDFIATEQDQIQENTTLAWWGIWTACGLLVILIIAPMLTDAFKFWR